MPKNSKENLYKNEQLNVKNKILEILNINQDNNYFTLYDLDNNTEKQNAILALEGDCEKYFGISNWSYFRYKRENKQNIERPYLLLIRGILSNCNIEFEREQISLKINKTNIITSKYKLVI